MKSTRDEPKYGLEDWDWIGGRDGREWLDTFVQRSPDGPQQSHADREELQRIRIRLGDSKTSLVAYQAELRQTASRKFSDPSRWLWTRRLLEQSSDEASSRLTASYFPDETQVLDLCCGAGADSVALASRSRQANGLICIDNSDVACALTRHNLASHRCQADVQCTDASGTLFSKECWVQLDPDRRPDGQRTTTLEFFAPDANYFEKCIQHYAGGSIKLAPATEIPMHWEERVGRQYISVSKSVRQQRVWWGTKAFEPETVTLSVMRDRDASHWHHCTCPVAELRQSIDRVQSMPDAFAWIGDVDPSVRAAEATPYIAKLCNATVIGDPHGYLAADAFSPSLFVDWFEVQDLLTLDVKKLRKHLRERKIGQLEIKKRGVDLDIEQLRRDLKLSGTESATLILGRDQQRRFAILAKRKKDPVGA